MIDPDERPEHPTPHSNETAEIADDLANAVASDVEAHPQDVDSLPMRSPGGVNTEVDRIFGDDSER